MSDDDFPTLDLRKVHEAVGAWRMLTIHQAHAPFNPVIVEYAVTAGDKMAENFEGICFVMLEMQREIEELKSKIELSFLAA